MKQPNASVALLSAALLSALACGRGASGNEPSAEARAVIAQAGSPAAAPAQKDAKKAPAPAPAAAAPAAAGKAAAVNGVAIPAEKVESEIRMEQAQRAQQGGPSGEEADKALRGEVLDRFIASELIYQEAKAAKLLPTAAETEAEVNKLRAQFPDPKMFEETLKGEGLTIPGLSAEIAKDLAVKKWLEREVEPKVTVTDAEAKAYFTAHPEEFKKPETVKARHILVRVTQDAKPAERTEARKKIDGALARVKKGEDFAVVAKEVSEDAGTKNEGGALPEFARGELVGPFETAAFALAKDEISGIVETAFGLHVIQVTEKSPASTLTLEKVNDRLKEFLLVKARQQRVQQLVADLRKKAKVEMF